MDKGLLLAFGGIASWVFLKWYGLGHWTWDASSQIGIFSNLAWLTVLCAWQAHSTMSVKIGFLNRWRHGVRTSVRFVLALTLTMGCWYYLMVPETIENRKNEQIELIKDWVEQADSRALLLQQNPGFVNQSNEELIRQQTESIELFFSPLFFIGTVALTWTLTALTLSAIFTFIIPKIWERPAKE